MTISVLAWPKNRNEHENPYNALVYGSLSDAFVIQEFNHRSFSVKGADILHVHWPDRLLDDHRWWRLRWRFYRFLKAIDKLHRGGGKLVWTVHNLRSREIRFNRTADKLMEVFIQKIDGLIFLTEESRNLFFKKYGDRDCVNEVIPHPHYQGVYDEMAAEEARAKWGIAQDETVLGFFGKVRSNKGIDSLISAIDEGLAKKARLLIAGSPGKRGVSIKLERFIEKNSKTITELRFITNDEVGSIFGACDAMVFPYQDILNSGSALLALSLNRPIIAPSVGSFPELKDIVGERWVYLYPQPLSADELKNAIHWIQTRHVATARPNLDYAEPKRISLLTENFYQKLLHSSI